MLYNDGEDRFDEYIGDIGDTTAYTTLENFIAFFHKDFIMDPENTHITITTDPYSIIEKEEELFLSDDYLPLIGLLKNRFIASLFASSFLLLLYVFCCINSIVISIFNNFNCLCK